MANSITDKAIQQLFCDGVKIVKKWTNAKPTSSFAAQKITVDLNGYDFIKIEAAASTTSPKIVETEIPINKTGSLVKELISSLRYREITAVTTSGVTFGVGEVAVWGGNATTDNSQIIPINIYGIKLLGGGIA